MGPGQDGVPVEFRTVSKMMVDGLLSDLREVFAVVSLYQERRITLTRSATLRAGSNLFLIEREKRLKEWKRIVIPCLTRNPVFGTPGIPAFAGMTL